MRRSACWIGILLLLLATAPSTAWAQASVAGVTDTEVVVGWTTPLSGPAALWGVTGLGGAAWAEYINSQGGIHGRKIKVLLKDDGYNPTRAIANLQEMKGNVFALCGLLGTAVLNAAKDFCPENKIPLITAYGDVRIWAREPKDKLRYIFIAYTDYEDEAEYITTYALNKLGSKKIALFYQNDDYGTIPLAAVKYRLSKHNMKFVAAIPVEPTERDLSSQIAKLKA